MIALDHDKQTESHSEPERAEQRRGVAGTGGEGGGIFGSQAFVKAC